MRLQASQDGVFHSDHERTQEEAGGEKGGGGVSEKFKSQLQETLQTNSVKVRSFLRRKEGRFLSRPAKPTS